MASSHPSRLLRNQPTNGLRSSNRPIDRRGPQRRAGGATWFLKPENSGDRNSWRFSRKISQVWFMYLSTSEVARADPSHLYCSHPGLPPRQVGTQEAKRRAYINVMKAEAGSGLDPEANQKR